jgi:Tfp pilus assembly protein PilV
MKGQSRKVVKRQSGGFTLAEVMLAIIIVGVGIVSLMMLFASGTRVNQYGNDLSTAVFLAEQMRSMTDEVDFADLFDYDGRVFNGADASGNEVAGLSSYQQRINVQAVNAADLTVYVGPSPTAVIVSASVSKGNDQLAKIDWLRMQ